MLSVRCPSVLSVCLSPTLVYCSQTVGWIKMKLGTEVDRDTDHIVLDGDPALLPKKGHSSPPVPGPCLLWPNGSINQDSIWYGGRPWPRPHCVRWGPSYPTQRGTAPTIFGPMSVVAKRLEIQLMMDQDATWYCSRPRPRRHCVRWVTTQLPPKRGTTPNFRPYVYAKWHDGLRCHLVRG